MMLTLLAGGLVGLGLTLVLAALTRTRPDPAAVVDRLLPTGPAVASTPVAQGPHGWAVSVALPRVAERLPLRRYTEDLRLLGLTPEALAARKLGAAAIGAVFPSVLSAIVLLLGVRAPIAVPTFAGVVLALLLFWLPDLSLRQEAAKARRRMRQAACAYLDLVALERLADAGPTEALDRAAQIGDSAEFTRIRDALLRAELDGRPSWSGLADLADATGVVELADIGDIMRLAGHDGAAVYATLRARAASLRTQLLASATADANSASEHMVVPVSLLGLVFMALLAYPAFIRIMFG